MYIPQNTMRSYLTDALQLQTTEQYQNVEADKSIALIGGGRETTVIDGGGSGDVIHVTADRVNISGFTVRYSGGTGGMQMLG